MRAADPNTQGRVCSYNMVETSSVPLRTYEQPLRLGNILTRVLKDFVTLDQRQMNLSESSTAALDRRRPIYVSIEIVANLAYLAKHSLGDPTEARRYLNQISEVLCEMQHHPDLA